MIRPLIVIMLLWTALAGAAVAHEVRPALLQIVETTPGTYDVTWKQPVVGDMAIRLIPHLSSGALERVADDQFATTGFLVRTWRLKGAAPLDGQTINVEGLAQTVTDVVVRISAGGREINEVLRPSHPSMKLAISGPQGRAVPTYLRLGVEHILTGIDHLLFVLGLLLLIGPRWSVVKAITAFTVAHSVTLAVAALGFFQFPSAMIEALVALSIVFVACELARPPDERLTLTRRYPWLIAFAFGLLHGFAFAGALAQIGLPPKAAPEALFLFNVGVEIGQLVFIAAAVVMMQAIRRLPLNPAPAIARLAHAAPSYFIGGLASYWLIERVLAAAAV
jgi:hydrogenase/urease accessory protein HupE